MKRKVAVFALIVLILLPGLMLPFAFAATCVNELPVRGNWVPNDEEWFWFNTTLTSSTPLNLDNITLTLDYRLGGLNLTIAYVNTSATFSEVSDSSNYLELDTSTSVATYNAGNVTADFYLRIHENVTVEGWYVVRQQAYLTTAESDDDTYDEGFLLTIRAPVSPSDFYGAGFNGSTPDVDLMWTDESALEDYYAIQNTTRPTNQWLGGWNYRRAHYIGGSTEGNGSQYTMQPVILYYGGGIEDNRTLYMDELCWGNFTDIRFTADDGITQLPWWRQFMEENVSATYWVEVTEVPANVTTTIYVYFNTSTPVDDLASLDWYRQAFLHFDDYEDGIEPNQDPYYTFVGTVPTKYWNEYPPPNGFLRFAHNGIRTCWWYNDAYVADDVGIETYHLFYINSYSGSNYRSLTGQVGSNNWIVFATGYWFAGTYDDSTGLNLYPHRQWYINSTSYASARLGRYITLEEWTRRDSDGVTSGYWRIPGTSSQGYQFTAGQHDGDFTGFGYYHRNLGGSIYPFNYYNLYESYVRYYLDPEPTHAGWGDLETYSEQYSAVSWTPLVELSADTESYTHSGVGVENGTSMWYRIRPCRNVGVGWKNGTWVYDFETVNFTQTGGDGNGNGEPTYVYLPDVKVMTLNDTVVNASVSVFLEAEDAEGLSGYIFWNNATSPPGGVNGSWTALAGTSDTATETITLPSSNGTRVGVRYYVNDTADNWGDTLVVFPTAAVGGDGDGNGAPAVGGTGWMLLQVIALIIGVVCVAMLLESKR